MFRLPTFTQEQVDNAIYETIRKGLVQAGYLPDCVLYNTKETFDAQVAIIEGTGKKVIELYPVGFQQTLEELTYNSIYVDRSDENPGSISGSSVVNLVEQVDGDVKTYNKIHLPDQSQDINYSITVMVGSMQYERIIQTIINKVLGRRIYLKGSNLDRTQTANVFFFEYQTMNRDQQQEFIELTYQYKAKDLSIIDPEFIELVPEMTEFTMNIRPSVNSSEPAINFKVTK